MNQVQSGNRQNSKILWLVAGLGLIWNAMGAINVVMQMNANTLASMPAEQQAIVANRPVWATLAFAVGVLAGVLGCALLMLRKPIALAVLSISLAAIALHMVSYFLMPSGTIVFGLSQMLLYVLLPLAVAAFLVWYVRSLRLHH